MVVCSCDIRPHILPSAIKAFGIDVGAPTTGPNFEVSKLKNFGAKNHRLLRKDMSVLNRYTVVDVKVFHRRRSRPRVQSRRG